MGDTIHNDMKCSTFFTAFFITLASQSISVVVVTNDENNVTNLNSLNYLIFAHSSVSYRANQNKE